MLRLYATFDFEGVLDFTKIMYQKNLWQVEYFIGTRGLNYIERCKVQRGIKTVFTCTHYTIPIMKR